MGIRKASTLPNCGLPLAEAAISAAASASPRPAKIAPGARLAAFLRLFARAVSPRTQITTVALVLAAALTEGFGIALLAPILVLLADGAQTGGWIGALALRIRGIMGPQTALPLLLGLLLLVIVCRELCVRGRDIALTRLTQEFTAGLRQRLFDAVARASWLFVARERLSRLETAMMTEAEALGTGAYFLLRLPTLGVLALAQIAIAMTLAPLLTLAALFFAALIVFAIKRRRGDIYFEGRQLAETQRAAFGQINAFLDALKLAKSHHSEDQHRRLFQSTLARNLAQHEALSRAAFDARFYVNLGSALGLVIFVYVAVAVAALPLAELLVIIVIFSRLVPLIAELQHSAFRAWQSLPVVDDMLSLIARCEAAEETAATGGDDRRELREEIRLADVHFRYDKERGGTSSPRTGNAPEDYHTSTCSKESEMRVQHFHVTIEEYYDENGVFTRTQKDHPMTSGEASVVTENRQLRAWTQATKTINGTAEVRPSLLEDRYGR